MNARDRERITNAVDFWIRTKLGQQELSEATGRAQGGARAAVIGGRHLAGVNRLIVEELQDLGLTGLTCYTDRRATVPGYYRVSKSWDLLVLNDGTPVLAIEYKSMAGSEGKNLNNRADEVIGAAQDLKRAQEQGLVPATMLRGYVFLMEITPEAQKPVGVSQKPVGVRTRIGVSDPAFRGASYGGHETRSFSVSRGGRGSKSWSKVRPVTCEANAPKVSSGVSRWMFAMLFLAVFQTCSTGLWSGAYGGR